MSDGFYRNVRLYKRGFAPKSKLGGSSLRPRLCECYIQEALESSEELSIPATAGVVFEHVLRCWLAESLPMISSRALMYESFSSELLAYEPRSQGWYKTLEEIDAVIGENKRPECLVEIRCSCSWLSQRNLDNALSRRLEIARQAWPNITGATITVRTGPWRYRREPLDLLSSSMELDVDRFMKRVRNGQRQFIVVSLPDLQAWSSTRELHLDPTFLEKVHDFALRNFLRVKQRWNSRQGLEREVRLPDVFPWSFANHSIAT